MNIRISRNARTTGRPFFMRGRLPVRQSLTFIGGWLVVVRR